MSVTSSLRPIFSAAPGDRGAGRLEVCRPGRTVRQLREDLRAARADLDEQAMRAVEDLRQREVVAGLGLRPVPIETQKQVPAGSKQFTATTNASLRRAA